MTLIDLFIGRHVRVKAFGYKISGILIACQESNRYGDYGHVPNVLIIEAKTGQKQILRGWESIGVV